MKYMGSKAKYAKYILPIILKDRLPNQWYVEPFVGAGNIIDKVDGNRMGNDVNPYLVALLKAVSENLILPDSDIYVTEEEYKYIKDNYKTDLTIDPALVGFVGVASSYSGKWFGGYARGKTNKGEPRNYAREARDSLIPQADKLKGVVFKSESYDKLEIPPKSIIYCDPPYIGTTSYGGKFDHNMFWEWCRTKTLEGHKVFVSEYQAPINWKSLWSMEVGSSLDHRRGENSSKKGVENLFILNES